MSNLEWWKLLDSCISLLNLKFLSKFSANFEKENTKANWNSSGKHFGFFGGWRKGGNQFIIYVTVALHVNYLFLYLLALLLLSFCSFMFCSQSLPTNPDLHWQLKPWSPSIWQRPWFLQGLGWHWFRSFWHLRPIIEEIKVNWLLKSTVRVKLMRWLI